MSAPSTFDRLVARPVWPTVAPSAPLPREHRGRFAGASKHPDLPGRIEALLEAHDALCRNATDPLEVAAGLEAAGISDKRARASYDAATVFELAEHLYRQVPRRPVAVARADPWARPMRELMTRGLVYALPGLMLVAAMKHFIAAEAMLLLLVSVVAGGANQALSWLYSVQLGRKQVRSGCGAAAAGPHRVRCRRCKRGVARSGDRSGFLAGRHGRRPRRHLPPLGHRRAAARAASAAASVADPGRGIIPAHHVRATAPAAA